MTSDPYEIFIKRYGSFTDIQKAAFGAIKSGENCIITAPTGSGKTEAAVLPVLDKILKGGGVDGIQAIYITPLRALNRDLMKRLESISAELGISIAARHGDTPTKERQAQAAHPPQILITTPETVQNLFLSQRLRGSLANVRTVIVDEMHELYANKRGAQLSIALERLAELAGKYQRIGISATMGNLGEAGLFLFAGGGGRTIESRSEKEIRIDIEMPQDPGKDYKEFREKFDLDAPTLARIERMADIVGKSDSVLIFANTRQVVESLGSKLIYFNKIHPFGSIGIHHGSLDKNERIGMEDAFKEGRIKGIMATSSLELGIDIGSINMVVQYGSPRQVSRLVQRIGRGGHREKAVSYGKIIVANYLDALESVAIINQMREGEVELQRMESMALDVLANQVCAMALEYKKVPADAVYRIAKRAAPYARMDRPEFERVLNFLEGERLIRMKEGEIGIGSRSRDYFFTNISVIPDAVRFLVKDAAGNRVISSLDEKFVSNYLDEGSVFITKGLPWKVISIEEGTIFVEPSAEFEAAIPDWEGEDIPVSYATARRVFGFLGEGVGDSGGALDRDLAARLEKFREAQRKYFRPEGAVLHVEELEDYAILYTGCGKLANEFLARIIGHVASQMSGSRLLVKSTPYVIIIDYGGARKRPSTAKVLGTLKNYATEGVFGSEGVISGTELFRYKFVRVCKLFGVVEKRATVAKRDADRLINFYKESPIFDETVRDLRKNYLDVEHAEGFLEGLRKGRIRVNILEDVRSPLTEEILKSSYYYKELLVPALPDDATVKEFEGKINSKRADLLCTFCGLEFFRDVDLGDLGKVVCTRCASPMVCVYGEEKAAAVRKSRSGKPLGAKENASYREAIREAGLVESYGNRALAALGTYGIGPANAARVLKLLRRSNKQFIIDLIDAQKNFIKTKKYWK
jgi:ATP-dependent Lhr-like helicase